MQDEARTGKTSRYEATTRQEDVPYIQKILYYKLYTYRSPAPHDTADDKALLRLGTNRIYIAYTHVSQMSELPWVPFINMV